MAKLLKWALVFGLPAIVRSTWQHRYDLLTFSDVSIQDAYETLTVTDECTCRKLCVQDVECSAASVSPVGKLGFECLISHLADVSKDVKYRRSTTTFIKERKPKYFYWSARKALDPDDFSDVCSDNGGNLGTVFTIQDLEYIRENLMSDVTSDTGNFIPLRGTKNDGWTRTWWPLLEYGIDTHLLFKNYENNAADGEICHKISATDGLTLRSVRCYSGPETEVLCYKYEL